MSELDGSIRFEILGPLRVSTGGREVPIRSGRERVVLAMLLLHAGRTVPVEQLAEAVWSGDRPSGYRNQLQGSVSRLRRQLGPPDQVIATEPAGYRVRVDPQQVDAYRFRGLVTDARTAAADGRKHDARDRYQAAAGLWQGPALVDVDSDLVREMGATLEAECEQALEECLETELALGGAGELVSELTELVRRYPYRERLHAALMRALYRAGRTADALVAFRHARQLFHDELGTEPGNELQQLHQAILNQDPELYAKIPPQAAAPLGLRELPVEASCFVGREQEIARVRGTLAPADRQALRRPPVVVLYGPGGTGKSALAVRVAHELVGEFSDGQLYEDLCGSTPGMRPLPAVEVLGRFLRRLGVHPSEIPSGEAEAAARFRSLTASRRLLLVLDNAAEKEQVAPLVPGTPSCAVLITSRYPLPTLDADDRLRLDALPDADGLALLTGLTGRLAIEPNAARAIVTLCGGLPLAIRIAAGRLAARPDVRATEYAGRLADRSRRLDELQLDDLAVRASIRTSYDALLTDGDRNGELAAKVFRMIGLLHVPDVAPPVVAAMLDEPDVETASAALDRLVDAQLVEPIPGGRYRMHDLVRLVASECSIEEEVETDRGDAVTRAVAFFTCGAWRAVRLTRPSRVRPFGEPTIGCYLRPPSFSDVSDARRWVDAELESLEAALAQAATMEDQPTRLLLWLGDALWESLDYRCDWPAAFRVSRVSIIAAEKQGSQELKALSLHLHGRSEACLGSYDNAVDCLQLALDEFLKLGNTTGVGLSLNALGVVHDWRGEYEVALTRYREALDLATELHLTSFAAGVLGNMSVSLAMLGQLDAAASAGERSAAIATALGDRAHLSSAMVNLSIVHCLCGDQAKALRCSDRALALTRETGDRLRTCEVLVVRSEVSVRRGRLGEAGREAELACTLARSSGYGYAVGVAESQRSKIYSAMGRITDASHAYTRAQEALTRPGTHWDPLLSLLMT